MTGCEEEVTHHAPKPPAPADAGATAVAPKVPTLKPAASASAPASASAAVPAVSIEMPKGPLRWTDFSGPILKPEVTAGDSAWAVLPVSVGWDTLKFAQLTVDRIDGDAVVFKGATEDKREVFVPGAFVTRAKPATGIVKGDTVFVAAKDSRAFARVTAVEDGKINVRYRFAGDIQELQLDPGSVVKLDGSLGLGAPVGWSEPGEKTGEPKKGEPKKAEWHPAYFVQTAEDKTWVVTTTGKPVRVPNANVKPLAIHPMHKPKDKVWVAKGDALEEAHVLAVEDDGLRYKLKLSSDEEMSAPFEAVSTPIK